VTPKRKSFVSFLFLIAAAVTNCFGQQSISDLSEASLEQPGSIKVYSAPKHLQAAEDEPSSITVVTTEEIQKHGYRRLADDLRSVRGFDVAPENWTA
jgi:outer membrane receptor for ferrienterochelin and colicin